jgi:hypothetical protein
VQRFRSRGRLQPFCSHATPLPNTLLLPADLLVHVKVHDPWFFHATANEDLASIVEDGIRPGSELGRSNAPRTFHRTRPGHVYLATLEHCRRLQTARDLGAGTVRVDVRRLDPFRIDPDEDLVQQAWHRGERWVDSNPPLMGPDCEEGPHGEGTLGLLGRNDTRFRRSACDGSVACRRPDCLPRDRPARRTRPRGVRPALLGD